MSDSSDDMEAWSGLIEDFYDNGGYLGKALIYIRDCKPEKFENALHMINSMKKAARVALEKEGIKL
jgi:hypothetical protein